MDTHKRVAARPLYALLDRLEKVTEKGGGQYSACCPAHEDKSPSLGIKETDDRLLVNCLAGCYTSEVMAAVGLSLADLFNTPLTQDYVKPLPVRQRWDPGALLQTVAHESLVVCIAAEDMSRGNVLSDNDKERLTKSVTRIRAAAELVA